MKSNKLKRPRYSRFNTDGFRRRQHLYLNIEKTLQRYAESYFQAESESDIYEHTPLKRPRYSRFNDTTDDSNHKLRFAKKNSRLHFTENELKQSPLLLDGDIYESENPIEDTLTLSDKNRVYHHFPKRSQIAKTIDESLDSLAQQSDNEGVQMGNMHRKKVGEGMSEGLRKGRKWRSGHDERVRRREIRRENRRKIRDVREKAYEQRHGKPPLTAQARKKLQQKHQQMKKAAEKRFGKGTVNTVETLIRAAVRMISATVRAIIAFVIAPIAGVVGVYGVILIMAMLIGGALITTTTSIISAYTAEPDAIEQSSCYYTKLEAELDKKIKDIPSSWEWAYIDEFRYDLDPIGHDAFQIMAYLNVKYPGFNLEDELLWQQVKTELDYIFDLRYELILDEEIEIRSYEESSTDEFGNETTTTYYYPYYILNVILHAKEQEPILLRELNRNPEEELTEWYGVLQETQGARQEYANPFGGYDWRGSVSSLYGWRIDPIGGRELQMHHGLDIAMPRGTPIFAGISGVVRYTGFDSIMGSYIILDADDGRTIKYGHCDSINVSMGEKVKAGETIVGRVGSSGQSTGAHLHVEIMENGEYLDPIYSLGFLPPE